MVAVAPGILGRRLIMEEEGIHLVAPVGEVRRAVMMVLAVRLVVVVVVVVQVVQAAGMVGMVVEEEGYRITSRRGSI